MSGSCPCNGGPFTIPSFKRSRPLLEEQLLQQLEDPKFPLQPVGAYDLWTISARVQEAFSVNPVPKATLLCLEKGSAETLLRCFLACIQESSSLCPMRNENALRAKKTDAKKSGIVEIPIKEIKRLMILFLQGFHDLSLTEASPFEEILLWSRLDHDKKGAPITRMPNPVYVRRSKISLDVSTIPDTVTIELVKALPQSFIRDAYDHMIQALADRQGKATPLFPCDPRDRRRQLRATDDVQHISLPQVYAERPNPWLQTSFHKRVLCILTFYKLSTIRTQVLSDLDSAQWPRDLTARGFNLWHPAPMATELLYQECGVRLHLGDREYAQDTLKNLTPQQLQSLFGSDDVALKNVLSPREIRQAKEVLDFPLTLVQAYLKVLKRGDTQSLDTLFAAMDSAACLNLRFHALMVAVKDILDIKSVGMVVQSAYESLVATNPKFDDATIGQALPVVKEWLQEQGIQSAWDDKEKTMMPIHDVDITVSLQHLGFEKGA